MVELYKSLEVDEAVLNSLLDNIRAGELKCRNHVQVKGDDRFWGVDDSSSIVVDFKRVALKMYRNHVGREPKHLIVMANYISADKCPDGSGGGWHVDSLRSQYKVFMYLTECTQEVTGPLTLLSSGSIWKDRMVIFLNYLRGNKFRFSQKAFSKLLEKGFKVKPVLLKALTPFFVNTSFIHRGGEISEGERIMLTAYMFDVIPDSIRARVYPDDK